MTPETQPPRDGYRRTRGHRRNESTTLRSGPLETQPPWTGPLPPPGPGAERAREDRSIVGAVPLLAVLAVTVVGVSVAWREGPAGGGVGGVVGGAALLAGAAARLLLPARLAGLLATRKRATDVLTLTIFGAGLLILGLVLPR